MEQISEDGTNSVASSGQVTMEMSIIEELDLRFGAAKNKQQILAALEHCAVLHRIPLCNPNTTSEQARKDFRRERVLLNDVPFIPDNVDEDRCHAFDKTLNVLVARMARRKELYDTDLYSTTEAITDAVLQRACRTGAGADSFFAVQKLLCVEGTFVTQRTYVSDPPIRIDVFVADPEVEGEYLTSSRKASTRSESSSLSGIAMDREARDKEREAKEADGQRTPPATPPVGKSKRTLPSPLKISLKNMGFSSSSSGHLKTSKHSQRNNNNNNSNEQGTACIGPNAGAGAGGDGGAPHVTGCGVGCGGVSAGSGAVSGNFTPPATPSTGGGTGRSFSSSSSAGVEDFRGLAISRDPSLNNNNNVLNAHNSTGAICCRIQVMNSFAIYDVAAIEEITGVASQDPDPWLEVEAIVVDESNFKTDKHWRKLQLIATCPATGKVYTSNHDASSSSRHSGRLSGRMILQELTSWLTSFPTHHHLVPHLHHHHHHNHNHKNKHHRNGAVVNNHPNQSTSVSHTNSADDTNVTSVHHIVVVTSTTSYSERVSPYPSDGPSSSAVSTPAHLDSSFLSVSSSAGGTPREETGSDYSPINSYPSSSGSGRPAVGGVKKTTSFSAADTRRQLSLHAVALAALQQDQDTPNSARDEYCYSAPHSLKYSAVPSPASTLQGLQVHSFDTADAELAASRGRMLSIDEGEGGEGGERHTDNTDAGTAGTDRGSSEMHSSYSSLPLRTHDELNLLIPALRQLPGRSGFSSETSSDPEAGAHVYSMSEESSAGLSFSRSTFNSKDVYLTSSITSSVGAETDGSLE